MLRAFEEFGTDDRVLLTVPEDIRWLCGFTGSNGWLLVGPSSALLVTDGRYTDQARQEAQAHGVDIDILEMEPGLGLADLVARAIPRTNGTPLGRVHFQSGSLDVQRFRTLEGILGSALTPATAELTRVRRKKDAGEIELIERAARIADGVLAEAAAMLGQRPSERDVRDELEYRMRRSGADGPSYDTIVASGPLNSAKPHHRPGSTVIEEGHSVVIDVGALVDGYHSDMTRTYLVGEVDPELSRLYEVVREAQTRGLAAVAPGTPCREVDRMCSAVFEEAGVADLFVHGTGHGVGLAIHEEPFIGRASSAVLEVGDVVTVEPGLYRRGLGGVRIEDLVVVTESAHRCLTSLPKDSPCQPSQRTI